MPKRNHITATYRINADECVQVTIDADNAYPEALATATANARQLVADILADVLELTRDAETVAETQGVEPDASAG